MKPASETRALVAATLAVAAALALLEAGALPPERAQRATDTLQLVLAAVAAAACLWAAPCGLGVARAFWTALGLGCLSWAGGQAFWVAGPFSAQAAYAEADLLFTFSTGLFLVAYVLRPGRALRLSAGIDVAVMALAMLYVFCQLALVHLLTGDAVAYEVWSTFLFDFRGLALLPVVLWAIRSSDSPWRELHVRLASAFVLLMLGGVVTNQSFDGAILPRYHPGLYDLPWTVPFVWIAIVARGFAPAEAPRAEPDARARATGWRRTRRATVAAFVTVLLFPVLGILAAWGDDPRSPLARWRAAIALLGTLLVAGLYLARQLIVLREAEKTLREGEDRYRALLDTGVDGVGVYGADFRVHYVSGALAAMSGHRPEERVGRSALDLVHPDDAARLRAMVAALLEAPGVARRAQFRGLARDGSWRQLELDAVNRLGEPAVRGIVANFRDVTEQRLAEEERERSLSLLEATLESTADGILVVARADRVVRFNQKFAAMWRLPQEVLQDPDAERMRDVVLEQLSEPRVFLDTLERLHADPLAESFDTLRFKDGRVFERYSLPQRLAGEVVGRVYSFRDVTERVHAEQAMARLVAVIEATPDFVGTCDALLRPLYVNRAGRRMLGRGELEPIAERHIGEFHPEAAAARLVEEAIPQALGEGAWSGESRLKRSDGREIPVLQVVLAHRSPAGEVVFFSTIARDISQRIEAEQALRRSHTMAALGSLVAGVAHEVRNPLFGISSTLDAFEARFGQQPDHRQYVHVLRDQLARLTSLMNDLLEYAKPTRLELAQGRFEDVVLAALAACAPLQQRSGVRIETRLARELPPLRMDERRLTQVVRNLLENALQHAGARGSVGLEARLVHENGAPRLECSVEDDGPGFLADDLPHVFEPFFTRRHGGTGLGLSIVHRIVADHDGSIAAQNRPQGGARLTISLPVSLAHQAAR